MSASTILQLIIWIINPAGGVGKTLVAQVIEAIGQLTSTDVLLASQDRGNQALKHVLESAALIDPSSLPKDAVRIVSRVENREIFVIDVGANPSSNDYDPLPFGAALNAEIAARNGRMIAVVPTTPLKIHGSVTAAKTARDLINEGIDVHVVKNHQDLSGRFGDLAVPDGVQVSELGHLPSGLMALIREHQGSIADLYLNPTEGYQLAGNYIGDWLMKASRAPLLRSIFGDKVAGLTMDSSRLPRPNFTTIKTLAEVTDGALRRNCDRREAYEAMLEAKSDADALRALRTFQHLMGR